MALLMCPAQVTLGGNSEVFFTLRLPRTATCSQLLQTQRRVELNRVRISDLIVLISQPSDYRCVEGVAGQRGVREAIGIAYLRSVRSLPVDEHATQSEEEFPSIADQPDRRPEQN